MTTLLITGATGTLGSALVRAAVKTATTVIAYARDDGLMQRLATAVNSPRLRTMLGDVRDRDRLTVAMAGVDTVVHLAALKHVDEDSANAGEVLRTNVLGTVYVVEAAIAAGVSRVVLLSSDKACEPTSLYGATKLCVEHYAAHASTPRTKVAALRCGNLLASRGSVVDRWRVQAARGDPIRLTDPNMTRFMITVEEAALAVSQVLDRMEGGEIFVPRMPSVRLLDLAAAVAPNAQQVITGPRPGEKLHEAIITDEEWARVDIEPGFFVIRSGVGDTSRATRSDQNTHWRSTEELRRLLHG